MRRIVHARQQGPRVPEGTLPPRRLAGVIVAVTCAVTGLMSWSSSSAQTALNHGECLSENFGGWPANSQAYSFDQRAYYWTGVAVSPAGGDDKEVRVFTLPNSQGTLLATSRSASSGTAFVVGDFNHMARGMYYPTVTYGSASADYTVSWESGTETIALNTWVSGAVGGTSGFCGLIRVYDLALEAGTTYVFDFSRSGSANIRYALFRNPGTGSYWAGRGAAVLESSTKGVYTAPATDIYGVVVFNDSPEGLGGSFSIRVGACNPLPMCSWRIGVPEHLWFTQYPSSWIGVAVRPGHVEPWGGADVKDISVTSGCGGTGSLLAASSGQTGTTAFVVGDFNHSGPGTYYTQISSGSAISEYTVTRDAGGTLNLCTWYSGTVGGNCNVIRVYDLALSAGFNYEFEFTRSGSAEVRYALFRNPGTGAYWAGRHAAVFERGGNTSYSAPATDVYGLVIFSSDHGTTIGEFSLRVSPSSTTLVNGTCRTEGGVPRQYTFTQSVGFWAGVAVSPAGGDDKSLGVHTGCGGTGVLLASSAAAAGATNFVVGDFNHTPITTYYPVVSSGSPTAGYALSWENGTEMIPLATWVSGAVGGATGTCGLIRVYDLILNAASNYQFEFSRSGSADVRYALFRNPGTGAFWAGRSAAVFESSANRSYTAPETDAYGVVVFSDSPGGASGSFSIRVTEATPTGVPTSSAIPTEFALERPQPTAFHSSTAIRYAVPGPGPRETRLKVYDLSGRCVRTLVDGLVRPGSHEATWDGRGDDGAIAGAGMYFVRLGSGGFVGTRSVVRLR